MTRQDLHKFEEQVNPGGGSRLFIASVHLTHNKLVVQAQPLPPSQDVEVDVDTSWFMMTHDAHCTPNICHLQFKNPNRRTDSHQVEEHGWTQPVQLQALPEHDSDMKQS